MLYRSPKTTVGAIVFHPEYGKNTIVLTRRNIEPFKNYWCLPGGHIEIFEKVEEAIMREVKEETNLTFEPYFFTYSEEIFIELDLHHVALFFYGPGIGNLTKDTKEVSEINWFDIDKALSLKLAFHHNHILSYYKKHFNL